MQLTEKQISLMDDILNAIDNSEEWIAIQQEDPYIKFSNDELIRALGKLDGTVGWEQLDELKAAVYNYANSVSTVAIMYGMKVELIMQAAIEYPIPISKEIADRVAKVAAS